MRFISGLMACFSLLCAICSSQTAPPPLISPDVHADGSVTFRVRDPQSTKISLELEGAEPMIMQKDDLAVWSVTRLLYSRNTTGISFGVTVFR